MFTPQRSDSGRFEYTFHGTDLHVKFYVPNSEEKKNEYWLEEDEFEYAFTEVLDLTRIWEEDWGEGWPVLHQRLPVNVIINPRRVGDTLILDLLNWIEKDAPHEVRFPARQVYTLP